MQFVDLAAEIRTLLLVGLLAVAYLGLALRWGRRRGRGWSRWRAASWGIGLALLALVG